MDLKEDIFLKAKRFLLDPKAAFDAEKKSDVFDAFKYMVIWLFVTAILTAIVLGAGGSALMNLSANLLGTQAMAGGVTGMLVLTTFFSAWIFGIIGMIIAGLWLHLWAYLVGARNKVENTLKTVFYGSTPRYVLGWIPFIGVIGYFWSLGLYALGLTRLQNLSTGKSILAIIIAVIIPALVITALVFTAITAMQGLAGMGQLSGAFVGV